MDFSWPEAYIKFKEKVIDFAQSELNGSALKRDKEEIFPVELWQKCAQFGILALPVKGAYGGEFEEVDFMRSLLAMEGFGYGCEDNGLAFGLNAQMWTVQTPIMDFGSESQKQKYLIPMVQGKLIGAHALTEPNAGSDILSMEMTAIKQGDGYLLNGKKHLITLAPVCDFVLVFANAKPQLGKWGVSAFLVDKDTPGFYQSEKKSKLGMRSIPIGDLEFKDCLIPHENILGNEGLGFSILNHSLEYDRCCILASQLGAMQRQLEDTISFAKKRKQYNQSISKFQSVSNRIANMKLRLETARLLLYKTAWLKQCGEAAMLEAAMLKLNLSESFLESSLDAIRTFGGVSYLTDTGVDRDFRDSVGGILYAGTSDIQRNIISKLLGL